MRWKIDENVHPSVAAFLQERGHDAATIWDEDLQGTSDSRLADICRSERRTLLTLDLDFANILVYPPDEHPGIVVLRLVDQTPSALLRVMQRAIGAIEKGPLEQRLWVIDESSIRVRQKP